MASAEERAKKKLETVTTVANKFIKVFETHFDVWEEHEVNASTLLLTEKKSRRTLTVPRVEPQKVDVHDTEGLIKYHRSMLAYAIHFILTQGDERDHVKNFLGDGPLKGVIDILKAWKPHMVYLEMHTTPWLESGEYTREKIEHDGELLKFPPLPLLDDVLAELRVQHPPASLRPPGKSSSQRTAATSSQQTPAQQTSAQRTPAQRTTRSASKRPRENDTGATPAEAAPASTTPDNPEGPLSTRTKRQRRSPDVPAESPVPADVSPDRRADVMSDVTLAMVTEKHFHTKLELENQVSDLQEKMEQFSDLQEEMEQHRADMTGLKDSVQSIQQAIQALRTELQNQPGPSVQQRPVTGAANAASAPAAGADDDFFAKAIDNQKKENGGKKMTTVHEGEAFGVCIYNDFRDEVGLNLFLALNDNRRADGRYLLNYALFKNETQQKLFPIPGSKKHVWSLATSLAPSKSLTLKSILEGELYVQHTNRLEGMLPAPVAVQPPDNASQQQTAQPTPRTKAIAKMTETMQENNSMMRRFGQYLGFRSPMAKGTTMPPPSPRQVRLSPLGMNQGDAAIAQQSPQQARSPTSGGATTQRPRSGSRTSGGKQRKSPETRATTQRPRSGSRTSGGKQRKSPETRATTQRPRSGSRTSGGKRKSPQSGDKQSVQSRRSSPRLTAQASPFERPNVPRVNGKRVPSNDFRKTPGTPAGSSTWLRD